MREVSLPLVKTVVKFITLRSENLFLCSYNNNESLSSYLRQVEDETLRLSVLSTWTANVSAEDIVVDGCLVPGGTPALGVGVKNPTTWQEGGLEE